MLFQWIVVVLVIAADQFTKHLVETRMHLWQSVILIKGFLKFTYVRNTGMGFSFLANDAKLAEYIALIVIAGVITFSFMWKKRNTLFNLSMGLVIGGALSNNAISRMIFGSVTDFIQLPYWPIFNVADSCVVAGAIGIGLYFLRRDGKSGEDRIEGYNQRSR